MEFNDYEANACMQHFKFAAAVECCWVQPGNTDFSVAINEIYQWQSLLFLYLILNLHLQNVHKRNYMYVIIRPVQSWKTKREGKANYVQN